MASRALSRESSEHGAPTRTNEPAGPVAIAIPLGCDEGRTRWLDACFAGPWSARAIRTASLVSLILLVSLADLWLTLHYLRGPGMSEGNPIARWVISGGSPWSLAIFKLGLCAFTSGILWVYRRRRSAEIAAWVGCLVMGWLCFQWHAYTKLVAEVVTESPEITEASTWVSMPE